MVRDRYWWIRKGELKTPVHELRRILSVHSRFNDRDPIPLFAETEGAFGIPLYYKDISRHATEVIDLSSDGFPADFSFLSTLRPKQQPIMDRFMQSIAIGKTGFLIEAPTGTGKTVILLSMLSQLKRTTLVVVPRSAIVKQWRERIVEHTDIKDSEIGIAQQSRCDYNGKKIVIGTIQSLMKDKYGKDFKRYFGAVVYDEVHVTSATEFSKTVTLFPARYRIGASATMKRTDGTEAVYESHVGEVVIKMKGGTDVKPRIFLREYKAKRVHPYVNRMTDAKSRRGVLLTEISKDVARNALIAVYIKKFVESGRRTLLLSDRKEQVLHIAKLLRMRHGFYKKDVGIFMGETKEMERKRVLKHCPIILATYGVMAMAIDVPDLRALVFATPMSEIEQPLGRILRLCDEAKDPVTLDIIDSAYPDAVKWAYKRQRKYESAGAEMFNVST